MLRRSIPFASTAAWLALTATPAAAQQVNATSTTVFEWRTDNDDDPDDDDNYDDDYGAVIEHLDVSGSYGDFFAGLRVDFSTFLSEPQPDDPAIPPNQLVDRYQTKVNLEKMRLRWTQRDFQIQAGDSYVSFGRGLALSMRKIDEFGTDSTVRGAKATYRRGNLSGTALVGFANINNLDEASGRYADFDYEWDDPFNITFDRITGAQASARLADKVTLGAHGVQYVFYAPLGFVVEGEPYDNDTWYTYGPTVDAMGLTEHFGFYLEGVGQYRNPGTDIEPESSESEKGTGYGLYGSATYHQGKATVLLEGKAYGNLLVVQPSAELPVEFEAVQYHNPPTLERVTQILDHPQQDTVGGRARFDWRASDRLLVFANYALIRDYLGFDVEIDGSREHVRAMVHDPYAGLEARWNQARSRALISGGWRAARGSRGGDTVRSDTHVEVNIAHAVSDRWSVEVSGSHLERGLLEPVFPGFDYVTHREGTWTAGVHWSPKLKASLVYGYTTEQLQPRTHYFAGALEVRPHHRAVVRAFAGMRRGGLFCISGVCRNLPPFEGVQLTATLRY